MSSEAAARRDSFAASMEALLEATGYDESNELEWTEAEDLVLDEILGDRMMGNPRMGSVLRGVARGHSASAFQASLAAATAAVNAMAAQQHLEELLGDLESMTATRVHEVYAMIEAEVEGLGGFDAAASPFVTETLQMYGRALLQLDERLAELEAPPGWSLELALGVTELVGQGTYAHIEEDDADAECSVKSMPWNVFKQVSAALDAEDGALATWEGFWAAFERGVTCGAWSHEDHTGAAAAAADADVSSLEDAAMAMWEAITGMPPAQRPAHSEDDAEPLSLLRERNARALWALPLPKHAVLCLVPLACRIRRCRKVPFVHAVGAWVQRKRAQMRAFKSWQSNAYSNKAFDEEPPAEHLCPISFALMEDPVRAPDGVAYERAAIGHWLGLHGETPMRVPARREGLAALPALRAEIAAWVAAHECAPPAPPPPAFSMQTPAARLESP